MPNLIKKNLGRTLFWPYCTVTYKIIGDDFDLSVLKYSNTGVGGAKINSNCRSLCHFKCMKLPEKKYCS